MWDTFLPRLGKMSCDRYEWIQKKYEHDVYRVPFAFFESNELKSVSSECETFAIIISRQWSRTDYLAQQRTNPYQVRERIWIFTETNGIVELNGPETMTNTHVMIKFDIFLRIK